MLKLACPCSPGLHFPHRSSVPVLTNRILPLMLATASSAEPQCPMRSATFSGGNLAQCPVAQDAINPRNNMPYISQSPAPNQSTFLPTERLTSSIPRTEGSTYNGVKPKETAPGGDATSNWEYPSPQQFYNALVRKGWNTPEEQIEAMLLIHNRLNEDAWAEVIKWEVRFGGGAAEAAKLELAEFAGIHSHLSHKAQAYQLARRYFPSLFTFSPPFDRHDWIVRRPRSNTRIRYVIDYYSSRKRAEDEPEFHLDVRPASDSFTNVLIKLYAQSVKFLSGFLALGPGRFESWVSSSPLGALIGLIALASLAYIKW